MNNWADKYEPKVLITLHRGYTRNEGAPSQLIAVEFSIDIPFNVDFTTQYTAYELCKNDNSTLSYRGTHLNTLHITNDIVLAPIQVFKDILTQFIHRYGIQCVKCNGAKLGYSEHTNVKLLGLDIPLICVMDRVKLGGVARYRLKNEFIQLYNIFGICDTYKYE